jgi:hypothetical protein
MPWSCFSYPADVPIPSVPRQMTTTCCFSYPADLRRMTVSHCFSYSVGAPLGVGNRDAAQSALPGLRSMTFSTCFRY